MVHKHHSTHHILGYFMAVLLLGGILGSVSGITGESLFYFSDALEEQETNAATARLAVSLRNRFERRLRRSARLEHAERVVSDIGRTYPMQTNTFAYKGTASWGVALQTGTLSYDRLGVTAPIGKPSLLSWEQRNWRQLEDQLQFLLLNGVAAYPHSVLPGERGRLIIAGHSSPPTMEAIGSPYEQIFSTLPDAKIGDVITVRDASGNEYTYVVTKTQIVPATYTQILLQDKKARELLLFTCYPVGTTRERFVVWAEMTEEGSVVASK